MGWESRANGQYYYQKRRIGPRVVSQYLGSGPVAEAIGQLEQLDQQRRKFERDVRQAQQAELAAIESQVDEFCTTVKQIIKSVLLATGHHQHKRQWRKRKMSKDLPPQSEMQAALKRVQNHKATSADKSMILSFVNDAPHGWELAGNLYQQAITSSINTMSGNSSEGWLLEACIEKRLDNLKADFGYKTASPIERLLIEQVCLCWLRLYWLENLLSEHYDSMSLASRLVYERRLTMSQRRFNQAVETLAKIRWLARRSPEILQINVAQQQQVNVS